MKCFVGLAPLKEGTDVYLLTEEGREEFERKAAKQNESEGGL